MSEVIINNQNNFNLMPHVFMVLFINLLINNYEQCLNIAEKTILFNQHVNGSKVMDISKLPLRKISDRRYEFDIIDGMLPDTVIKCNKNIKFNTIVYYKPKTNSPWDWVFE
jgi:hypothetical protein